MILDVFSKDYVKKFATEEALREQEAQDAAHLSSDSESSMSDFSEDEAQDMEL
jgi:ubiquitin-conjugating enzyme E2 H